ncbi:oligosaccharide flippase family protein [bacterium]|nr:oligosaccharide flippase family protein [bacterium]
MKKSITGFFKQSVFYGIGTIFERLLSFLMLPLFTNLLTRTQFGTYQLWIAAMVLLSPFLLLGLNSALIRFYAGAKSTYEQMTLFSTCFWTVLCLGAVFCGIGVLFAKPLAVLLFDSAADTLFVHFLMVTLLFDSLNMLGMNLLKIEQRAPVFVLISLISGISVPLITVLLIVVYQFGVAGAIGAVVAVSAVKFCVIVVLVLRRKLVKRVSFPVLRELLHFGLPFLPTVLAASLMVTIDRFLLREMAGLSVVGVYAAGCRLGMAIALFTKAFQYAWEPFISLVHEEENASILFGRIFTYYLLVTGMIFLNISMMVENIVRLDFGKFTFFNAEYFSATAVVPIVMLGAVFYGMYVNFSAGAYIRKKSRYYPLITIVAALLNLVLNLILIPVWGMVGAAWATAMAYLLMAGWMFWVNQHLFPVNYEYKRLLKLVLVLGGAFGVYFGAGLTFSVWSKFGLMVLVVVVLWLVRFFEPNEIQRVRQLIHRFGS